LHVELTVLIVTTDGAEASIKLLIRKATIGCNSNENMYVNH